MAFVLTDDTHYFDIAAAIRAASGEKETKYKPAEMACKINSIYNNLAKSMETTFTEILTPTIVDGTLFLKETPYITPTIVDDTLVLEKVIYIMPTIIDGMLALEKKTYITATANNGVLVLEKTFSDE